MEGHVDVSSHVRVYCKCFTGNTLGHMNILVISKWFIHQIQTKAKECNHEIRILICPSPCHPPDARTDATSAMWISQWREEQKKGRYNYIGISLLQSSLRLALCGLDDDDDGGVWSTGGRRGRESITAEGYVCLQAPRRSRTFISKGSSLVHYSSRIRDYGTIGTWVAGEHSVFGLVQHCGWWREKLNLSSSLCVWGQPQQC